MHGLQVYIVRCSDSTYYVGVSNDVERRVWEHNNGDDRNSYTFYRRPAVLVWFSDEMDPTQAIELEKQIKDWSRKKKEAIIRNQWSLLPELSQNKLKSNISKNKPDE